MKTGKQVISLLLVLALLIGVIPAAMAGDVPLERNGYTVIYDGNGADEGAVPVDSSVYQHGDEVTVKPSSLRREGWNFSGWTSPNLTIQDGKFNISENTELKAAWGRAYVKLSSRTATAAVKETEMLSRSEIEKLYSEDKAFYNDQYWSNLASVTLHKGEKVPDDPSCKSWDISANTPGAVMAWVTPASEDEKYDLHISGQSELTAPTNCNKLFERCTASQFNNFEILDTSNVTDMSNMFFLCSNLTTLNVGDWDTSNVTSMSYMFDCCTALTNLDVSKWDTSNVTDISSMFGQCFVLTNLDINNWDISKVTDINNIFFDCFALTTLDLNNWDTSNVTNMRHVFQGCHSLANLNVSKWDTSNVTDMACMFYGCSKLTTLGVSNWNTAKVTNMTSTFDGCSSLSSLNLSGWDTSKVTDMSEMFYGCYALTTLETGSKWDTSSVTGYFSMESMFKGCRSLTTLDVSNWDTSNVSNMSEMFHGCSSLTTLDVSIWHTSNVSSTWNMFYGCSSLTTLDMSNWDMTKVISMSSMFQYCNRLTSIKRDKLVVANNCSFRDWRGPLLTNVALCANSGKQLDPPTTTTISLLPSEHLPEQSSEEAEPSPVEQERDEVWLVPEPDSEYQVLTARTEQYAQTSDTDYGDIYANKKTGNPIDGGQVAANQQINYTLELQYLLNDLQQPGGVSGELTVSNQIPKGLTLVPKSVKITEYAQRIIIGDGGSIRGQIITAPAVSEDNVLTFTVNGLSAGARYIVTYSCTVPADVTGNVVYLNTASVDDSGLIDYADPVLHYFSTSSTNQDYVVSFDTLGGTPVTSQTVKNGGKVRQPAAPTREGFKFLGWYRDPAGSLAWNFNTDIVSKNLTLYAKWGQTPNTPEPPAQGEQAPNTPEPPAQGEQTSNNPPRPAHQTSSGSSGNSNTPQFVITAKADAGGSIDPAGSISVPAGSTKTFTFRPDAGRSVRNVLVDGASVGAVNSYTFENVQADHSIEVFFTETASDSGDSGSVNLLNTKDHTAFLRGFPGKTFHPYDYMTRGEIAQMFFNLLEDKSSTGSAYFSDVPANAWYADAVNTLKGLGILRGVGHRQFRPEQPVSRAEFTVIAVRFANGTYSGRKTFSDVNQDDWFFDQVMSATGLGWIKGYKDGSFRPDAPILRAEAAAVVNRMLGRKADKSFAGQHASEMRLFPDVASNYWAYYDILEATNAHDFHVDSDNSEVWEGLASSRKKN